MEKIAIPRYTLRIDAALLEKLRFIAAYNDRSANKELERMIRKHVEAFEKEHGVIKTDN
ncbi:MAG: Arc family DNA-binding protein [Ruminococcaceae bacterium]|nr:Arc family DNA-binding protein [Oscillospiraceae bacterium]